MSSGLQKYNKNQKFEEWVLQVEECRNRQLRRASKLILVNTKSISTCNSWKLISAKSLLIINTCTAYATNIYSNIYTPTYDFISNCIGTAQTGVEIPYSPHSIACTLRISILCNDAFCFTAIDAASPAPSPIAIHIGITR